MLHLRHIPSPILSRSYLYSYHPKILLMVKKLQSGKTALIQASWTGHLDVVNRLLDCKEIDIHVKDTVSRILIDLHHIPSHISILFPSFFLCVLLRKILLMVKKCSTEKMH